MKGTSCKELGGGGFKRRGGAHKPREELVGHCPLYTRKSRLRVEGVITMLRVGQSQLDET